MGSLRGSGLKASVLREQLQLPIDSSRVSELRLHSNKSTNIEVPEARLSSLLLRRSTGRFMVLCDGAKAEIPWWTLPWWCCDTGGVPPSFDQVLVFEEQGPRFCVRYPWDDIFYPST